MVQSDADDSLSLLSSSLESSEFYLFENLFVFVLCDLNAKASYCERVDLASCFDVPDDAPSETLDTWAERLPLLVGANLF